MPGSELKAISGEGKGRVNVALTGEDKPALAAQVEVHLNNTLANATFTVARRVDFDPDGDCTSTNWQPFDDPVTTSEGGAGAQHFEVHREAPFVSGFQFDIQFRVLGNGTELRSDCFTLTVK